KGTQIRMHRCPFHNKFVETILSKIMAPPNFPVRFADLKARLSYEKACPAEFSIGSIAVIPIPLSHPNGGSGYKFIEDGKSFVFLTDNELGFVHPGGLGYKDYVEFSRGADLLLHDAEYTPKEYKRFIEWGHSAYTDVLNLAHAARVKRLGLFHLNQERTDRGMDRIVAMCQKRIAQKNLGLECFAVASDMTFEL
ncbi:MAG: MBL fold metallo-hydrolase, partial [Desulfobacterales bacterium]